MAKMNEISLSRKKELEQPDEFMENLRKIFGFILKYKGRVGLGLCVFFSLIIGFTAVRYFSSIAENKASYLLHQGMSKYNSMQKEKKPAEICDLIEADFKSIVNKYPGVVSGKFAMLQLANIYYSAGKYDASIVLYERAIDSFGGMNLFENLIQMGLGYCHEAKGENEKAIAYFEKVIADPGGLMKGEALFCVGRIYGKIGEKGKRADAYKKIVSDYGNSIYSDIAKEHVSG
jgi:tetratricopeptide (TPR) repeat protein